MASVLVVLILAGLLAANALFVAVEFALVASPRTVLDRLAADGNRGAARISRILAQPRVLDRFVAVCQVGITIASLGLGMYGEHAIAERLAGWFADLGEA